MLFSAVCDHNCATLSLLPSLPPPGKVELVAFGGDRVAPLADNEAQRLATGSPMHARYEEPNFSQLAAYVCIVMCTTWYCQIAVGL